jgi:hypothetical protein
MRIAYLFLVSLVFISSPLKAQEDDGSGAFISGAYLHKLCETDRIGNEIFKSAHASCQSYIAGIIDYHKLLKSLDTAPSIDFCVPNTVKLSVLQKQVWSYLNSNAQHDDFNAAPAVTIALFQNYPCS